MLRSIQKRTTTNNNNIIEAQHDLKETKKGKFRFHGKTNDFWVYHDQAHKLELGSTEQIKKKSELETLAVFLFNQFSSTKRKNRDYS